MHNRSRDRSENVFIRIPRVPGYSGYIIIILNLVPLPILVLVDRQSLACWMLRFIWQNAQKWQLPRKICYHDFVLVFVHGRSVRSFWNPYSKKNNFYNNFSRSCLFCCLAVCLAVCLSFCLSVSPTLFPCVCPSVCLCVCLSVQSVCPFTCLFVFQFVWLCVTGAQLAPVPISQTHMRPPTKSCQAEVWWGRLEVSEVAQAPPLHQNIFKNPIRITPSPLSELPGWRWARERNFLVLKPTKIFIPFNKQHPKGPA